MMNKTVQIAIEFDALEVPREVLEQKPTIMADGTAFCCLLGPDPQTGVFGCGNTPQEAMANWAENYKKSKSS